MEKKITNLMITTTYDGRKRWTERFLFGDSREEYDRLVEEGQKSNDGSHPIEVFGKDGLEWQDDMVFLLDRCYYNFFSVEDDWPNGMLAYGRDLLDRPFTEEGEKRSYRSPDGRLLIEAVADCTEMVGGHLGEE